MLDENCSEFAETLIIEREFKCDITITVCVNSCQRFDINNPKVWEVSHAEFSKGNKKFSGFLTTSTC